jgi:hypothetical protein
MSRFELTPNERKHVRLRRHELNIRIETLSKLVKDHRNDPDFRLSINSWHRELMKQRSSWRARDPNGQAASRLDNNRCYFSARSTCRSFLK